MAISHAQSNGRVGDIVRRGRRLDHSVAWQVRIGALLVQSKADTEEIVERVSGAEDGRGGVVCVQVESIQQCLHDFFACGIPCAQVELLQVVAYDAGVVFRRRSCEVCSQL